MGEYFDLSSSSKKSGNKVIFKQVSLSDFVGWSVKLCGVHSATTLALPDILLECLGFGGISVDAQGFLTESQKLSDLH